VASRATGRRRAERRRRPAARRDPTVRCAPVCDNAAGRSVPSRVQMSRPGRASGRDFHIQWPGMCRGGGRRAQRKGLTAGEVEAMFENSGEVENSDPSDSIGF
jgi:hypothetical protein